MKTRWYSLITLIVAVISVSSFAGPKPVDPADSTALKGDIPHITADTKGNVVKPATKPKAKLDTITTKSGLKYIDLVVGKGDIAETGKMAQVHYTIWLADKGARGKKVQSSVDGNTPFSFLLGAGLVIKGWEEGLVGMKVGGKRTLIIKPELAWGANGFRDMVPPNSTCIFDVELLDVKESTKMH